MNLTDRFIEYVKIPTMSDENCASCPSSAKQLVLAKLLVEQLLELGLSDAHVDEHGYVYATLPANCDTDAPTIGFIAHMDTSPDAPDENIKPRVVEYTGEPVLLNEEKQIYLSESDYPGLARYKGQHLVVTDGTTLLGADDKAGIAEIMDAVATLIASGAKHGTVKIGFTPDEEIGRGADLFNVEGFAADYAYTVDGGRLGELEYENFNAASAVVTVTGLSIHPGSAKDMMKNASLIGCEFNAQLPADEIPSKTEGYEGFHHLTHMEGSIEAAKLYYIIRDHDMAKFNAKKALFEEIAARLNAQYGEGTVEVAIKDSYYNMKEKIEPHMYIVDNAKQAMLEVGITPEIVPVRGGTDGARLSYMGLPCPNLCGGGENFHGRFEYACVESMEKISLLLQRIITNAVK
ncbi:MAG: peptidase T [Firmicutes bacterium]|nr:peptidase T [Bacillota bacterium]